MTASRHPPGSIGHALDDAAGRLARAGIDTARLDARALVTQASGRDAGWLVGHPEAMLGDGEAAQLEAWVRRREAREPLAYILGHKEFWSLEFKVTQATLIPRPESETLVAAVLARIADRDAPVRVLDLGTGSGCLLLSVLHERPSAVGLGVDRSAEALDVARANAQALGMAGRADFRLGDWWSGVAGRDAAGDNVVFDAVITNPPYVTDAEMSGLAPEISGFEPSTALRAGVDGLDCYREILPGLAGHLRAGGWFAGEIGHQQAGAAGRLAIDHGLVDVAVLDDAAGVARCLVGRIPGAGKK